MHRTNSFQSLGELLAGVTEAAEQAAAIAAAAADPPTDAKASAGATRRRKPRPRLRLYLVSVANGAGLWRYLGDVYARHPQQAGQRARREWPDVPGSRLRLAVAR